MNPLKLVLFIALAGLLFNSYVASAADKATQAKEKVEQKLKNLKAADYKLEEISDVNLNKFFPNHKFLSVIFRQFPVGTPNVPPVLENSNLYAVSDQGSFINITDDKGLKNFFSSSLEKVETEEDAKLATKAFLRLAWQLRQDGFYTFGYIDESIAGKTENGTTDASGKFTALKGGNGTVMAELSFNKLGELFKLTVSGKVTAGPRPICQATKLLDKDLLVRRMAEQDLLVMGSNARSYFDFIRPQLSQELRHAADRVWQKIVDEGR